VLGNVEGVAGKCVGNCLWVCELALTWVETLSQLEKVRRDAVGNVTVPFRGGGAACWVAGTGGAGGRVANWQAGLRAQHVKRRGRRHRAVGGGEGAGAEWESSCATRKAMFATTWRGPRLSACMRCRSPPAGHQSTRKVGRAGGQGGGAAHISPTMDFGSSQQSVRSQALAGEGAERGKQRRARDEDNRKGRGRR
jgi:hypothetical protein